LKLGWPGLDRKEAPVSRPHANFRGFAQSGSNPGHTTFFTRLNKAKALTESGSRTLTRYWIE
jgi:hypothetical protein